MVSFLEEQFPHLTARYKAHYRRGAYVKPGYRDWLSEKICRIRQKHGLSGQIRAREHKPVASELAPRPVQGSLFEGMAA